MTPVLTPQLATWVIAGFATLGVIVRPFSWPEAVWAVLGALTLLLLGLISPAAAIAASARKAADYPAETMMTPASVALSAAPSP